LNQERDIITLKKIILKFVINVIGAFDKLLFFNINLK